MYEIFHVYILVDFEWAIWGEWGPCTGECGGSSGLQARLRGCIQGVNGGALCPKKKEIDIKNCTNNNECSSKFFTWSNVKSTSSPLRVFFNPKILMVDMDCGGSGANAVLTVMMEKCTDSKCVTVHARRGVVWTARE